MYLRIIIIIISYLVKLHLPLPTIFNVLPTLQPVLLFPMSG